MIFFVCSVFISFVVAFMAIYVLLGLSTIKQVAKLAVITKEPSLAIIIAVRNEEEDLEKALQSVCNINYENHRIIVVNDRSTDGTGEILKKFTGLYPKLTVTTISTLPDGWLGKNNALYQGYKSSDEEWLLFIDADIVFHPDAINKSVGYAVSQGLDHLTILPEAISRSVILNSVLGTFVYMLMVHMRPWAAKNPKSKGFAAIGAFNLVKRDSYEKVGTHASIKIRPDDDLQLGMMIKAAGLKQDVLAGSKYVSLEWYKKLSQFGNGILKNSFAVAGYSLITSIANVLLILLFVALPIPILLIFGDAPIRLMALIAFLCQVLYMTLVVPNKWWYAFVIPFAGLYIAYFTLKSATLTLKQGGIYWRDSFYSLAMLKGKK